MVPPFGFFAFVPYNDGDMVYLKEIDKESIPGLLKLLLEVNALHHEGRPDLFKGGVTKYDEKELIKRIGDKDNPIIVAHDEEDRVVGYVMLELEDKQETHLKPACRTLYIDDLCVDKEARGQGIGKTLYLKAKEIAEKMNCHNLTLHSWGLNENATSFYEHLGMKIQFICFEEVI